MAYSDSLKSALRYARWQARRIARRSDYVIYHLGRSGSTVLSDLLDQHPRVHSASELFWGYYGDEFPPEAEHFKAKSRLIKSPVPMLDWVKRSMLYTGFSEIYGFEVKPYHIRLNEFSVEQFVLGIEKQGIGHHVLLERKNYLRKIVSSLVASHRGQFSAKQDEKIDQPGVKVSVEAVQIDSQCKTLLEHLEQYSRDIEQVRDALANRNFLYLTYEDDVMAGPDVAYNKVCEFLGVSTVPVTVNYRKTTPFPLHRVISNFDEVRDALEGTRFEWMLDEESLTR